MNSGMAQQESEFHQRVDNVLRDIESALEAIESDIDTETNSGILTLEFANGSKVLINRQTPTRELWVAAKSGGFHFRFDGAAWRDTRTNESLETLLSRVITDRKSVV